MTKTMLLAAAAVLAGGAAYAASSPSVAGHGSAAAHYVAPKGSGTIVNQTTGGTGNGIVSQNFETSLQAYDAADADAFTITKSAKATGIVANGLYFNGPGPATSENVTFYKDKKGAPGSAIKNCTYTNVNGTDASGVFTITFKKACKLKKGVYWVSVVANLNFAGGAGGEWGWQDATETGPHQADWENPGGGFATACTTWMPELTCIPNGQTNGKSYVLNGTGK